MPVSTDQQRDACANMMVKNAGYFLQHVAKMWLFSSADETHRGWARSMLDKILRHYPEWEKMAQEDARYKQAFTAPPAEDPI